MLGMFVWYAHQLDEICRSLIPVFVSGSVVWLDDEVSVDAPDFVLGQVVLVVEKV